MADPKRQLPDLSNQLLDAAREVMRLEQKKRTHPISTPEFHRLAEEVEVRARDVFRIAAEEEALGDEVPTGPDSIDDVARERLA